MYNKLLIKGEIELVTGLHIGTGGEFAAIGAVDSPVVRDVLSGDPMIPGSSLKGKLRALLARKYNTKASQSAEGDEEHIKQLFGSMEHSSRLIFTDMILSNKDELEKFGIDRPTEIKFENYIGRLSGIANPRQIERAIRGCRFPLEIIYNVEDGSEPEGDITLLADAMKLLQYDYLGGSGSRGYGKVRFCNLEIEPVVGEEVPDEVIDSCAEILKEVEESHD